MTPENFHSLLVACGDGATQAERLAADRELDADMRSRMAASDWTFFQTPEPPRGGPDRAQGFFYSAPPDVVPFPALGLGLHSRTPRVANPSRGPAPLSRVFPTTRRRWLRGPYAAPGGRFWLRPFDEYASTLSLAAGDYTFEISAALYLDTDAAGAVMVLELVGNGAVLASWSETRAEPQRDALVHFESSATITLATTTTIELKNASAYAASARGMLRAVPT